MVKEKCLLYWMWLWVYWCNSYLHQKNREAYLKPLPRSFPGTYLRQECWNNSVHILSTAFHYSFWTLCSCQRFAADWTPVSHCVDYDGMNQNGCAYVPFVGKFRGNDRVIEKRSILSPTGKSVRQRYAKYCLCNDGRPISLSYERHPRACHNLWQFQGFQNVSVRDLHGNLGFDPEWKYCLGILFTSIN